MNNTGFCRLSMFARIKLILHNTVTLISCRLDSPRHPCSAVTEGVAISTSSNAAYEMMKQRGESEEGCGPVATTLRRDPPSNCEEIYEIPSLPPCPEPLPVIPPLVAGSEDDAVVYETIESK